MKLNIILLGFLLIFLSGCSTYIFTDTQVSHVNNESMLGNCTENRLGSLYLFQENVNTSDLLYICTHLNHSNISYGWKNITLS